MNPDLEGFRNWLSEQRRALDQWPTDTSIGSSGLVRCPVACAIDDPGPHEVVAAIAPPSPRWTIMNTVLERLETDCPLDVRMEFEELFVLDEKSKVRQLKLAIDWLTDQLSQPPKKRRSRSAEHNKKCRLADAETKIVGALTKHHQYENGSIMNYEPIGSRQLAELAGVGVASVSRFMKKQFEGQTTYKAACRTKRIAEFLMLLNRDVPSKLLLGDSDRLISSDESSSCEEE